MRISELWDKMGEMEANGSCEQEKKNDKFHVENWIFLLFWFDEMKICRHKSDPEENETLNLVDMKLSEKSKKSSLENFFGSFSSFSRLFTAISEFLILTRTSSRFVTYFVAHLLSSKRPSTEFRESTECHKHTTRTVKNIERSEINEKSSSSSSFIAMATFYW